MALTSFSFCSQMQCSKQHKEQQQEEEKLNKK
jgi:hypothetical protein